MNFCRLQVFLVSPILTTQKGFQALTHSITLGGCIDIINSDDWRNQPITSLFESMMSCDMLIVVGDFLSDELACCLVNIAHHLNKTIVQWQQDMKRKTVLYVASIKVQNLIAEYCHNIPDRKQNISFPYSPPISLSLIRSNSRKSELVTARALLCHACRHIYHFNLDDIAWIINRDRTSVLHLLEKYKDWYAVDYHFNKNADEIFERLTD